jgi:hypothetical protein
MTCSMRTPREKHRQLPARSDVSACMWFKGHTGRRATGRPAYLLVILLQVILQVMSALHGPEKAEKEAQRREEWESLSANDPATEP